MKLQFSRIITACSPELVMPELERCLRLEAWQVWRTDDRIVAYGIDTSPRVINCSNLSTFQVGPKENSTLIEVYLEYQSSWLSTIEEENNSMRLRVEEVLDCVRDSLGLPQEKHTIANEQQHALETSHRATQTAPDISHKLQSQSDLDAHIRHGHFVPQYPRLKRIIAATGLAVVLITGIAIWSAHHKRVLTQPHAPTPAVVAITPPSITAQPAVSNHELHATTFPPKSNNLRNWIEEWAASQRTRDADMQTSFYADHIDPYLDSQSVDRNTVYQDKKSSILNRQGLWTFKVEDVSIEQTKNTASVRLKKHIMMQAGSVAVSELFIPARLTLARIDGAWQIIGEQNLQPTPPIH